MNALQHQREAERLLAASKSFINKISEKGVQPVNDLNANLHVNDQLIAMARVHAMLARR